jgi:hypothetical protein
MPRRCRHLLFNRPFEGLTAVKGEFPSARFDRSPWIFLQRCRRSLAGAYGEQPKDCAQFSEEGLTPIVPVLDLRPGPQNLNYAWEIPRSSSSIFCSQFHCSICNKSSQFFALAFRKMDHNSEGRNQQPESNRNEMGHRTELTVASPPQAAVALAAAMAFGSSYGRFGNRWLPTRLSEPRRARSSS